MNHAFSMTDLGLLSLFWGIEVYQSDIGIKVNYSKYASYLINRLKIKDFNTRKTSFLSVVKLEEANSTPLVNNTLYRKLVGYVLYLTHNRPDISYAVSVPSRHMDQPHEIHLRASKRILNLVQGTKTHGIHYVAQYILELVGFTDSDWEVDNNDRKSTSAYVFFYCRCTNQLVK